MQRRSFFVIALFVLAVAGCRTTNDLPAQVAMATLETTIFSAPNDAQTLTFTAGGERAPKPYALTGFLYAKHWLECQATESGPFARTAVCRLDAAGRTYAQANGWTSAPTPGGCAQCETWTVPLAQAKLARVTDVTFSDKTHATVTYAYQVVPSEIGVQLADWMRQNPVAWCGPDPRAVGAWSQPRTGTATFVKTQTDWESATPAAGFSATFASAPASSGVSRPCT
ncbi:MAG: hypothetical protein GIX03_01525 [Candidatus Eremiobacteraeota bacterium]|nr:hypothetical protein [Candidatus Eremiobacteraeota bacterium]MBC5801698.1 hypothetical protein [Candidatus Eremiobacteraeota bacterium]MBC5821262.1 hypothetical protein [Candidatus Eremiobacteraeota bacterium]